MKTQFQLWTVPDFCTMATKPRPRQEGFVETPKFALADVDAETLAEMCDTFRAEVFRKASKADPASASPEGGEE